MWKNWKLKKVSKKSKELVTSCMYCSLCTVLWIKSLGAWLKYTVYPDGQSLSSSLRVEPFAVLCWALSIVLAHIHYTAYCNRWPSPPAWHPSTLVRYKVQFDRRSVGPIRFSHLLYYLSMTGRKGEYRGKAWILRALVQILCQVTMFLFFCLLVVQPLDFGIMI